MKKYIVRAIVLVPVKNSASGQMRRKIHSLAIDDHVEKAADKLDSLNIKYSFDHNGFFTVYVPYYGEKVMLDKLGIYARMGAE